MPEEWEIDLGIPDISRIIMVSILCLFAGMMFLASLYTVNIFVMGASNGYSNFMDHFSNMHINNWISLGEISVFIIAAAVTFVYVIKRSFLFKPKGAKKGARRDFIIEGGLLFSAFVEWAIAILIGKVTEVTLHDLIILPVIILIVAGGSFLLSFLLALKELHHLASEDKSIFETKRLLKPFLGGITLFVLSILTLIIGLVALR